MLGVLTGFIDELREAGVPVSMVEVIDSMRAVESIEIGSRSELRETLRATLVKNLRHERAFDTAFDVYFSTVPAPPGDADQPTALEPNRDVDGPLPVDPGDFDLDALLDGLLEALAGLDRDALRQMAQRAVDELAGMEPGGEDDRRCPCDARVVPRALPADRRRGEAGP